MESNSHTGDESMDKSQDITMDGDQTASKLVKGDENIYDEDDLKKTNQKEDYKDGRFDSEGEIKLLNSDESDKLVKHSEASNETKGPVHKIINTDDIRRLGPFGK